MKVRDGFSRLNGDETRYDISSDVIEIIADDGRELFSIVLEKDGSIRVGISEFCKHNGVMLDSSGISITPIASNCFNVKRREAR
jgi:hypothetical protein